MKKILSSILSLIILSQLNLSAQKTNDKSVDKKDFMLKHEKPNFSIKFPANYKFEESSKNKGLKNEMYRAVLNGDVFMLKFSEHKNPIVSEYNQEYLQASVDALAKGIKGSIIKTEKIDFFNHKGMEASISLNEKSLNVFSRIFIINKVQYEIIVITKSKLKTSLVNNFFNSFVVGY